MRQHLRRRRGYSVVAQAAMLRDMGAKSLYIIVFYTFADSLID